MTTLSDSERAGLLQLAIDVGELHVDVGDDLNDRRLQAGLLAVGHAIVDLADGADLPTVPTPWPSYDRVQRCHDPGAVDRAGCSALAAQLTQVEHRLALLTRSPLSARVGRAIRAVRTAMQGYVQATAAEGRLEDLVAAGRSLGSSARHAHRWLQPLPGQRSLR